jgi:hypothetical protein
MTEEERREAARRRQAKYRERLRAREERHEQGDHSTCRPDQCEEARALAEAAGDADGDVTRDVTPAPEKSVSHRDPPAGLGERGQRLWDEMDGLKLGPTHVLVLERACRLADRLARLDAAGGRRLAGGWWSSAPGTDGGVVRCG